jgi:hypothetical protein
MRAVMFTKPGTYGTSEVYRAPANCGAGRRKGQPLPLVTAVPALITCEKCREKMVGLRGRR